MSHVKAEQFEFDGDLKVLHKPTGTAFSTYRYAEEPDDVSVQLSHVNERSSDGVDYDLSEMTAVAKALLRERQVKPR
ncbi:hypothetical protein [Sinorhizobium meliloti]|uniref:hypothetical protein n=1 Tax=Rhizobium meliloti TaxID=382 RepID=UPI0001E4D31C|nr:hypothetical protein [Sinorhizobium meliloti]AEG52565.1 hypothetical protein Sinme_0807 [Sinorhizobium meliloti AK83]MDE4591718.1 hypothetical protein [Sinorhizobium meliloti]SEJ02636.1 hypothetical protein SAMN04244575_02779 [Sinorhizobium meliloti]